MSGLICQQSKIISEQSFINDLHVCRFSQIWTHLSTSGSISCLFTAADMFEEKHWRIAFLKVARVKVLCVLREEK